VSGTLVALAFTSSTGHEVADDGTVHRELQRVALLASSALMDETLKE